MKGLEELLASHPFLGGLDQGILDVIAGCARNVRFEAGAYICRESEPADSFYLLRHGRVALEMHTPARGAIAFQTLEAGEILGASWLVPPYRWDFDARAIELTRAFAFDAACLRDKCEADHHLGYELMKRFVPELVRRMQSARLQRADLYETTA